MRVLSGPSRVRIIFLTPLTPPDDDLHAIMRDFKRFTSRAIHERLVADGRKTLLTWLAGLLHVIQRFQCQRRNIAVRVNGYWQPRLRSVTA